MQFIEEQRAMYPDLEGRYQVLSDLHANKLWHQLTIALLEFVRDARSDRGDNLIRLYERFVSNFEGRLSQLQLVLILTQVATQYYPSRPFSVAELDRAIAFLGSFLDKQARLGKSATAVLQLELLSLRVKRAGAGAGPSASGSAAAAASASSSSSSSSSSEDITATLDAIKRDLAASKEAVDALPDGEDPIVPGTYYRVAAEYYKLRGPAHLFYESALLYLGHANVEALAPEARRAMASDIAVAALVGEGVYNFGEVNAQPVLEALRGSPQEWLRDLLAAFQGGDLDAFHAVIARNRAAFNAEPALAACAGAIQEKITLLAYMEMAARRPATDRSIPFADVARETRVPPAMVEALTMRAFSLGLLKGRIEQVEGVVHVTFIKPRVLDKAQIMGLKEKVDAWRAKAATALVFMEEHTAELLS